MIRELRGRLRLVVEQPHTDTACTEALEQALRDRLGSWFLLPILSTEDKSPGKRRLARELMNGRVDPWPLGWPTSLLTNPLSGDRLELPGTRWRARQALLSKAPWLEGGPVDPPWPMVDGAPRVTAFYSFKGGVGRSTTLAMIAAMLAKRGQRVVAIDLDLEAPGLTPLLLPPDQDPPRCSVLDHLLTEAATGAAPATLPVIDVSVSDASFHLVPAGQLDASYLERLARVDTIGRSAVEGDSPVTHSLKGLLKRLRGELRPDHILIDCRTGLNDLGGVALADLAHVDVLVGRDDRADLEGIGLVLRALRRRRNARARRLATVFTFLLDDPSSPGGQATISAHREALYELFSAHWYDEDELPGLADDDMPHVPLPIVYDQAIARASWLGEARASAWTTEHDALLRRLDALWAPEPVRG